MPVAESSVSEAVSVQRAPEVQVQRAPVRSSSPLARVRLNTSGPAASSPITSTKPLLGTRQLASYVVAEAAVNTAASATGAATPSVQRAIRPELAATPIQRLATSGQSAAELPIQRSAALGGPVEAIAAAPAPAPTQGSAVATPPLATIPVQSSTIPVQSSTAQQPPASNSTASASHAGPPHSINRTPHSINPRAANTNPVQRAVPIHRPTPPAATPLPLPMAFGPAAAPPPPAAAPVQRSAMTSFLRDTAADQLNNKRQDFHDTVADQFSTFSDIRDAASLVRDPSQLRQLAKQRGIDMIADSNPVVGALLNSRRSGESDSGSRGGGGGHRTRGRGEHQEMEQLAEKLVAPLARLLRTELRMDRERMGRLRDSGR